MLVVDQARLCRLINSGTTRKVQWTDSLRLGRRIRTSKASRSRGMRTRTALSFTIRDAVPELGITLWVHWKSNRDILTSLESRRYVPDDGVCRYVIESCTAARAGNTYWAKQCQFCGTGSQEFSRRCIPKAFWITSSQNDTYFIDRKSLCHDELGWKFEEESRSRKADDYIL